MRELGAVRLRESRSVIGARRKVLLVATALNAPEIVASRLATVTSALCRAAIAHSGEVTLDIGADDAGGVTALHVHLRAEQPILGLDEYRTFFDSFEVAPATEDGGSVHAWTTIAPSAPDARMLELAESIVARKERDELMADLVASNEDLQESLEDLRRTTSAKQRMEGELNVGREIQMSMLPLVFPPFPDRTEFSIFAALEPAREVGGDFYDFFFLDPEHLCVCVGDVSGKGVPSALFAAVTKTLVKSLARVDFSPAGVLTQVNGELADNNESAMFVTMFLGVLNVRSGTFSYCNAGHNPPLVRRRDGAVHGLSERHGPVAGAVPGIAYRESETILRPGDLLLMYTDGVTEATSTALELFAEARLTKVLEGRDDFTVNTVIDDTLAAVHAFEAGAEQADDITLLALAYEGTAGTGIRHVTIRNELSAIAEVQNQVEDFCSQHSIPSRDGRRIAVALDELLSNVISYGYRDSHQHDITIGLHFSGSKFRVTIEDDGIPFNPLDLEKPDVTAALDERNAGGLGIHLVREMLDEVEYQRRGARNFITIVASITPSDASLNERK